MTTPTGPAPSNRPPASIADQIAHLVGRGMEIPDRDVAERCLNHIGFHRLRAYWNPLETDELTASGPRFQHGTSFNSVMYRYLFDQRLRSLLLEAFSYIETSVKAQWAYQLVNVSGHGEFAHLDTNLFHTQYHSANLRELLRTYQQVANLGGVTNNSPTIWDLLPAMSFGQLSKWYSSLQNRAIGEAIAHSYGVDEFILQPALQHLSKVRNICAHHERLWDLTISSGFKIPRNMGGSAETAAAFNHAAPHKIYNTLVMTAYLMGIITPNGNWTERFLDFKAGDAYWHIPDADMGFPDNWNDFALWSGHSQ